MQVDRKVWVKRRQEGKMMQEWDRKRGKGGGERGDYIRPCPTRIMRWVVLTHCGKSQCAPGAWEGIVQDSYTHLEDCSCGDWTLPSVIMVLFGGMLARLSLSSRPQPWVTAKGKKALKTKMGEREGETCSQGSPGLSEDLFQAAALLVFQLPGSGVIHLLVDWTPCSNLASSSRNTWMVQLS